MERDNKKRGREVSNTWKPREPKKGNRHKKKTTAGVITDSIVESDNASKFHVSSIVVPAPPAELGVFEFPWQKEDRPIFVESSTEGCDLHDVFFSSLVDGCQAAIGFPGDRLSLSPAPISIPDSSWSSDQHTDSIWSCALRQPLAAYSKASIA